MSAPRSRRATYRLALALSLSLLAVRARGDEPDKAVVAEKALTMKLGGIFTLDNSNSFSDLDKPNLTIGKAELGANLGLSPKLEAVVLLAGEDDLTKLTIDQAAATLKPGGAAPDLVFGRHTFNHGFMTTRLISDPLLLDRIEIKRPGVSAYETLHAVGLGGGLTVRESPSLPGDSAHRAEYTGVANFDLIGGDAPYARLSTSFSKTAFDVDLALTRSLGPVDLDAEAYQDIIAPHPSVSVTGYSAGAAYNFMKTAYLAVRADGMGDRQWKRVDNRIGAGLVHHRQDGIFAAVELSHDWLSAGGDDSRIAFQIGLESNLELPGFERKTLTQD